MAAQYVSLAEDNQAKPATIRGCQIKYSLGYPATQLNVLNVYSLFKLGTVPKRLPFRIKLSICFYDGLQIDFFYKTSTTSYLGTTIDVFRPNISQPQ